MVVYAPVKAWAMAHDGRFGFEVFELELPFSVIERYCVKRHPPDLMMGAVSRILNELSQVKQTPIGHYAPRSDKDPSRDEGPLE